MDEVSTTIRNYVIFALHDKDENIPTIFENWKILYNYRFNIALAAISFASGIVIGKLFTSRQCR